MSGHRDGNATSCPGDLLYAQLPELRTRAAQYAGPLAGVTVRAAATTLRGITSASLSGALRFADGSSPDGAPVDILYATAGSAFSPLARVYCAADGQFATTLDIPQTGTIRARFPGDATRAPLESGSVRITVVPSLSMAVSRRRLRRRRRFSVSGIVTPASETQVTVNAAPQGARPLPAGPQPPRALRDGRYRRSFRPSRPGLYRVTVRLRGTRVRQYVRVL